MPDEDDDTTTAPEAAEVPPEGAETAAGAADLGDAGKRALDAMKADRNAARAEARAAKAEADALKAQIANASKPAEEQAIEEARRAAVAEATTKANARIVRAEIRAAAAGKLADPKDALLHLNPSDYDVSDDGDVDGDSIAEAIADLLARKPYLAAQQSGPVTPAAGIGQGVRQQSAPDLNAQAAQALKEGRVADAISIKQQIAAAVRG